MKLYTLHEYRALTYSIIILVVDISFKIFNKRFHCALFAFFNCNVQGSPLTEKLKNKLRQSMQYKSLSFDSVYIINFVAVKFASYGPDYYSRN